MALMLCRVCGVSHLQVNKELTDAVIEVAATLKLDLTPQQVCTAPVCRGHRGGECRGVNCFMNVCLSAVMKITSWPFARYTLTMA